MLFIYLCFCKKKTKTVKKNEYLMGQIDYEPKELGQVVSGLVPLFDCPDRISLKGQYKGWG